MDIRLERKVREEYEKWLAYAAGDADLVRELRAMQGDEATIYEAFYSEIEFGTSGLRGLIGAGTNRMNIYTVARATQGLANYLKKNLDETSRSVAIGFDSRVKSDIFAETAARVFAANGIKTFIYREIMPVPCLSYAVRELRCAAGVMITASHNPADYNGYKVYNPDGCQITTRAAGEIFSEIERVDMFEGVKKTSFRQGIGEGLIEYIPDSVFYSYTRNVLAQSLDREHFAKKTISEGSFSRADFKPSESVTFEKEVLISGTFSKDIKIVYSPLHGAGYVPVTTVLRRAGYGSVNIVEEQTIPDGSFPTCPVPNPENREALLYGISLAEETEADIVIATDPDCDRVGVAVRCLKRRDETKTAVLKKDASDKKNETGHSDASGEERKQLINERNEEYEYRTLTGNEVGILLLDYICLRRIALGKMPIEPLFYKTIVTSELAAKVAASYGVETRNVLTGFKFIGEQIGFLEEQGENDRFLFGFEESLGYLAGTYVRDKDGVVSSLLICEMSNYYKSHGKTLADRLNEIYENHGYCINSTHSFDFPGASGFEKMKEIMAGLRTAGAEPVCHVEKTFLTAADSYIGGFGIIEKIDYMDGIGDLPKSDVIKFILEDGSSVIVRPSGTEPKIKVYLGVEAPSLAEAEKRKAILFNRIKAIFE